MALDFGAIGAWRSRKALSSSMMKREPDAWWLFAM
jgi:hypothetical protein